MNRFKTNLKTEIEDAPSLLEFYRVANQRELLSEKDKMELDRLEKGNLGEEKVFDFIQSEGNKNWTVIRNTWLFNEGPFECDLILITDHAIHTFEVKHYTGRFTYENGACNIGQIKMDSDCIQQARKSFLKLQSICKRMNSQLTVHGAIVFSSAKNKVVIHSPVQDIEVLQMPDLYEYIQSIKQEENNNPYPPINSQQVIQYLQQYAIENLYSPEPISPEIMKTSRKGICCGMCKSFDVTFCKHYVHCDCGFHESREEAIVRSACEYGALTYDRNFSTGDILDFIDNQGSSVFIQKILAKHFRFINKSKYSSYENNGRDYPVLINQFDIDKPAYYHTKNDARYIQVFKG